MPWLVVSLVVIGLIWWDRRANIAAAKALSAPTGLPAGASYLAVVPQSDNQTIYASKMNLAQIWALNPQIGPVAMYTAAEAQAAPFTLPDAAFSAALALAQQYANALGPSAFGQAGLPFSSLRTDGTLDYATAAALNTISMGR